MAKSALPYIEELYWPDVMEIVLKVDPNLAKIIDQTKPSKKHTFIRARYPFGAKILHDGKLHIPTERGNVLPIDHHEISEILRRKLNYRFVPMGLILNKSIEVFFETEERIIPIRYYEPGNIFGLWQLFDPEPSNMVKKIWNLSAGARSIFMLPMISDSASHTRLKRDYDINTYQPKSLLDHREVFIDIARHAKTADPWTCDILFFTNTWANDSEDNLNLIKLHKYWLNEAWSQSFTTRNYMNFDAARENFVKAISRRNLKPKPHILNTLKHLMTLGEGIFPGFVPAGNCEQAAPIRLIQDAYINSYLLKQHAPIIMQPNHLTKNSLYPSIYYSLSFTTILDLAPKSKISSCIMADIRELKMLMQVMQEYYEESPVTYEFFHAEEDRFGKILNTKTMPSYDEKLMIYPAKYGKRIFPFNSPFLRGCVKITRKN